MFHEGGRWCFTKGLPVSRFPDSPSIPVQRLLATFPTPVLPSLALHFRSPPPPLFTRSALRFAPPAARAPSYSALRPPSLSSLPHLLILNRNSIRMDVLMVHMRPERVLLSTVVLLSLLSLLLCAALRRTVFAARAFGIDGGTVGIFLLAALFHSTRLFAGWSVTGGGVWGKGELGWAANKRQW